jgi:hypothetical protein
VAAERYDAMTMDDGSVWEIDDGWEVVGVDGQKVGVVKDIEPDYVVVGRGLLFTTERFVPVDAISAVEPGRVFLNVTRDEIDNRGWTTPPLPSNAVPLAGDAAIPELATISGGESRVDNALDRRLADESISVSREPVPTHEDGHSDVAVRFEHLELTLPIYGEKVALEKRPVVYELFRLMRGVRERGHQFQGAVRREHVRVTRDDTPTVAHLVSGSSSAATTQLLDTRAEENL